jgi:recombination protein RecT
MAAQNALRNHVEAEKTGGVTTTGEGQHKTLAHLLTDPKIKQQMALALPKHMTADRLARIALTEIRKNPKLAACDQQSFLGAIMQLAALGLEPGGALGHAYLIPFDKRGQVNGKWQVVGTEVQLILGYRGMLDLARRSGQILSLEARAVYAADHFEVELGLDSKIVHKPDWTSADRGELTFVYAVAKLKDGGVQFDVMSRADIERVRNESQGFKAAVQAAEKYKKDPTSTWHDHFEPMALKTVIRRLFKYLPVSIEIQRAVGLDELADAGVTQHNALVIDGQFEEQHRNIAAPENVETPPGENLVGITPQEIHDAISAAEDIDALDAAVDLISLLDKKDQAPLHELGKTRRAELAKA